jgi:hypothetical protein
MYCTGIKLEEEFENKEMKNKRERKYKQAIYYVTQKKGSGSSSV